MTEPLRLFSYTRAAKDDDCQRARYYAREFGGSGLVAVERGWALVYGNIIHAALEQLALTGAVDYKAVNDQTKAEAVTAGYNLTYSQDWGSLAEGTLRGFVQNVWPVLMAEYDIDGTEAWIEYEPIPGYRFRARQDIRLRNKFNGHLCYVDYKTTASTKPQWVASWSKAVQLHSSMYALKQSTGIEVQHALVIGLAKGYEDKEGRQRSPFTYGYVNREYPMMPQYSYEYKRTRGWELFSVVEEFGNSQRWVADMPVDMLSEQFPQTAPITPRFDIAEKYFRQQLIREQEVADAIVRLQSSTSIEEITRILDTHFKQNFSKCEPAYGYKCEFAPICWIPWIEADPLGSGQFKRYESDVAAEELY